MHTAGIWKHSSASRKPKSEPVSRVEQRKPRQKSRTVCLHSAGSPEAQKSIEKTLTTNPELARRAEGWSL